MIVKKNIIVQRERRDCGCWQWRAEVEVFTQFK